MEEQDMLDAIMELQEDLQNRLGYDFNTMTMPERTAYIKEYVLHATDELHEVLRELPYFKPWKKYDIHPIAEKVALHEAQKEFIDVMHFMMNIALALGFTSEKLYDMYLNKNSVNHDRQQDTKNYKPCVEGETNA